MAAQYTAITLPEMETFLKRAFRVLRPTQGTQNREIYYDLKLSPQVVIRVWTSIVSAWGSAAGAGQDAIRVQFFGIRVNRPLVSGKAPIVKRTQNWRNSLQDRIEEYLELYEEKAEYWDERGGAEPGSKGPAASSKQVNFILSMGSKAEEAQWDETGLSWPVDENEVQNLTTKDASKVIEILLSQGLGRRYASETPNVEIREVLRQEIARSLQASQFEELSREKSCGCTCGGDCKESGCTCGGNCQCSKPPAPVAAKVASTTYEDPVVASLLDDLLS
jgi:hypothetical protein